MNKVNAVIFLQIFTVAIRALGHRVCYFLGLANKFWRFWELSCLIL